MKKLLSIVGIVVLVSIVASAFGPLFGIAAGYYCFKRFMRAFTTVEKVAWAIAGLAVIQIFLNVGTFVTGLLALGALYEIFKDKKAVAQIQMD